MKKCSHCKSDMQEDCLFCTNCGNVFPKRKTCIRCGKIIDNDCDWCVYCGAKQTTTNEKEKPVTKSKKTSRTIILSILIIAFFFSGGIIYLFKYHPSNEKINEVVAPMISNSEETQKQYIDSKKEIINELPCPEPKCGGIKIENLSVVASNTLKNQGSNSYHASNLLDENNNTAWASHFTGEEVILTFYMKAQGLYKIFLVNGYNKSIESFDNNSPAKDVRVYVNGTLAATEKFNGCYYHWPEYIMLDRQYDDVREVKIIISSVYEGNKWNDLCITNISFYSKSL